MKLLYKNLSEHSIEKLIICSLERSLYQAIVVIDGVERLVWKNEKTCLQGRSLMRFREFFDGLNIAQVILRHESAYDEMVGLPVSESSNRLEVPLGKPPYG